MLQRGTRIISCARLFSSSSGTNLSAYGNVLGGENICPKSLETFHVWHETVSHGISGGDTAKLHEIGKKLGTRVHPRCKFSPPTYFKDWEGRDEFLHIISCVGEVFGKSFTYGRQWVSPNGRDWALEFKANIGDTKLAIHGIDLVKLDEDGMIIDFAVLARPPSAVAELKTQMMKKATPGLIKMKAKQAAAKFFGE
jgi:hypothetical protein